MAKSIGKGCASFVCALAGALLCGYAGVYGGMAMGLKEGGWNWQFIPFLFGGWALGAIVALITWGICLARGGSWRWALLCPLIIPPAIVFMCAAVAFPLLVMTNKAREAEQAEMGRVAKAEEERLYALLKENPEIGIREKWYQRYDLQGRVFMKSLDDPAIPYTLDLLKRLYAESPRAREELFRHSACTREFLVEHFQEAYDRAFYINYQMLASIVSNPNTPIELVKKVAYSSQLPYGAVGPAAEHLRALRRERKDPAADAKLKLEATPTPSPRGD